MKDQDEIYEAATETPAFLGCPAHMPKTLPGGFDGTEPDGSQGGEGVPPSPDADADKAAKRAEYFRKHYSFCDGLFPIHFTNTEDGQMASCWIGSRRFTFDMDSNERDDGKFDCAAVIKDNGKVVATIETSKGKSISGKVVFAAFKAYVKRLSGSNAYKSHGGFLKQAAKRAAAANN